MKIGDLPLIIRFSKTIRFIDFDGNYILLFLRYIIADIYFKKKLRQWNNISQNHKWKSLFKL